MKRIICLYLYRFLLLLSNYIDNRYLKQYKIVLGTSLLVLTGACQNQKKDNKEDRLCYVPLPITEDTVYTQDSSLNISHQTSSDISDMGYGPEDMARYVSSSAGEDSIVPPKLSIPVIEPEEVPYITCYEPSCYAVDIIPNPNEEDTTVYVVVEEMPEFPGGTDSLMKYIQSNLIYPQTDAGIQARVIVSFVIEKDGSVNDPKVVRAVEAYLDEEALRVVRSMPDWKPGKNSGKTVRVRFSLPIQFR